MTAAVADALTAAEARADKAEAERDALLEEASALAAGQCLFPDGTGLTGDEYGNQICAMKARAAAEDEKHEALNQLDSERHSVAVLEKRVAELRAENARLVEALHNAEVERDHQRRNKDQAYEERNRLVALLAGIFPSGVKHTNIPGWNPEWHGAAYIDFPWGQASWHFHDSQAHLFAHLPLYKGEWDGHTTEAKYEAIARAALGAKP
jgi:hypothetical protein